MKLLYSLFTYITNVLGKNRNREYSTGNKTVPGKVATTHTEDGHKQDT